MLKYDMSSRYLVTDNKIVLGDALPELRKLFNKVRGVEVAVLLVSVAGDRASAHDFEIALKPSEDKPLDLERIAHRVAEALGVKEDRVGIVNVGQCSPELLSRILKDGVVVKGQPEAIEQLSKEARQSSGALMEPSARSSPDPALDKLILSLRVEEVRRDATFIRDEILRRRVEELSYKEVLALERAMYKIAESMLDVCRHLVSVYSLGPAGSGGEHPRILAEATKMPRDLAEDVMKLAELRDVLVHHYLGVRTDVLYETAKDVVERVVGRFAEWARTADGK
jgi:uncharacterized protein YutE (UPF0331/DUF86 family)